MQAVGVQIAEFSGVGISQNEGGIEDYAGNIVGVAPGVAQLVVLQELQHIVLIYLFDTHAHLGVIDGLERYVHVS